MILSIFSSHDYLKNIYPPAGEIFHRCLTFAASNYVKPDETVDHLVYVPAATANFVNKTVTRTRKRVRRFHGLKVGERIPSMDRRTRFRVLPLGYFPILFVVWILP